MTPAARRRLVVTVAATAPIAWLAGRAVIGQLGVNPVETLQLETGQWALRWLWLTLAITPLRRWTKWSKAIQWRRPLGLLAFTYAVLHLLTYLIFDAQFDVRYIIDDVAKRRFIAVGMLAFLMLFPLAVTSTKKWIKRLGHRWQLLHRLIYPAAVLAWVHLFWKQKADYREAAIYLGVLIVLFLARLPIDRKLSRRSSAA